MLYDSVTYTMMMINYTSTTINDWKWMEAN